MKNLEMREIVIERENELKELIEAVEIASINPENNMIYTIYYDMINEIFYAAEEASYSTYEHPDYNFALLTIEHRYNEEDFEGEYNENYTIKDAITDAIYDTDIINYDYEKILENLKGDF